jgi:signal transduction histidine kinase
LVGIRTGKIELRRETVALQDVIERALETCGDRLKAKAQTLRLDLPPEAIEAEADPLRLTQVLVNLINNAVKYTPEGGVVTVSLRVDDGHALISVSDTGAGMAPDSLPRVFDLYMQVPMDHRPLDSGLGIGLSLVKQFVELHGGSVSASSAGLGQGSRFEVRLPRSSPGGLDAASAAGRPVEGSDDAVH